MGWKGTVRSIAAAARAAERDAQRRHKAAMKAQMIANAEGAVDAWEGYIDNLISVHVDLVDAINWQELAGKPEPSKPILRNKYEERARRALEKFKPGVFDFLVGGSAKKKKSLEQSFQQSPELDQQLFEKEIAKYNKALKEWESDTQLARRLISGDESAVVEVIKELQSFEKESLIGSAVSFSISDGIVHAKPEVHSEEIVPSFRRKQLASGKLSETKMPSGQFNELYQDYVCSVALKVAGDLFHILPFDELYVTCQTEMLNSKTGHQELTPILSVQFIRDTFIRLNPKNIDPSDSMKNFNHSMSFKKTKGFSLITPLSSV